MTNFEKYCNDLLSIGFALIKGKPANCRAISCSECDFQEGYNPTYFSSYCNNKRMEWLKAEYEEPKISIPDDTPIDTKVLVSTNGIDWYKRHYAGFKDGEYYAWNDGRTSFTVVDAEYSKRQKSNKRPWKYMKLYE